MAKRVTKLKSRVFNREQLSLTAITLRNIKSVSLARLDLKPLTLIVGANSSGKSTALQALMLIAQNYSYGQNFEWALNGQAANFGQFQHLAKRGSTGKVQIEVEFSSEDRFQREKEFSLKSSYTLVPEFGNVSSSKALLASYVLAITDKKSGDSFGARANPNFELSAANSFVSDVYVDFASHGQALGKLASKRNQHFFGLSKSRSESNILPAGISSGMPIWELILGLGTILGIMSKETIRVDFEASLSSMRERALKIEPDEIEIPTSFLKALEQFRRAKIDLAKTQPLLFEEDVAHLVMQYLNTGKTKLSENLPAMLGKLRISEGYEWLNEEVQASSDSFLTRSSESGVHRSWTQISSQARNISGFFKNSIHYLGPLRSLDGLASSGAYFESRNIPVGRNGELLASALQMHLSEVSIYPLPGGEMECEFGYALDKWLKWFELGSGLHLPDDGFSRRVTISGEYFFQVGTGVSQVVPVIALALLSKPNSTVLIEQPELHLHPKLQQRIADFFIAMIGSGRRFVLETHSEYIVNRIRARVSTGDVVSEKVALYFATRNTQGSSIYNLAEMSERGLLLNWPPDFFDLTAEDSITIAENNFD